MGAGDRAGLVVFGDQRRGLPRGAAQFGTDGSLDHAARRPAHADECRARGYRHDGGRNGTTGLLPPGSMPIQTPQGGTNSINSTQRLFGNTPYGGAVQGSTIYSPMPAFNGTGFSTGRLRTNTSAYRAIPGPLMTAPPYSLGNPAYQNGQTPSNTTNPPAAQTARSTTTSSTGTTYNKTGRANTARTSTARGIPRPATKRPSATTRPSRYGRGPNGTAATRATGNTPARPNATPQAPQGPIQYGWW